MNSLSTISRDDSIRMIAEYEIEQLISVSIEHFAIPLIVGFSMDELSQEDFERMGAVGKKPEPLSKEAKIILYKRIQKFMNDEREHLQPCAGG